MVQDWREHLAVGLLRGGVQQPQGYLRGLHNYTKTINKQIVRSDMLSSQMEGLFDETSASDDARARYFSEVFFEEEGFEFSGGAADAVDRFYTVWYARPEDLEPHEYKVEVVVKGRRFGQRALRWEGDWTQGTGSGPLIAAIPEIPADLEPKIDEYLGLGQPA